MGELRIIGQFPTVIAGEVFEGEIIFTWDKDNAEEIDKAEKTFKEYTEKGWIAIGEIAEKKMQVFAFNPIFDKIILTPLALGG